MRGDINMRRVLNTSSMHIWAVHPGSETALLPSNVRYKAHRQCCLEHGFQDIFSSALESMVRWQLEHTLLCPALPFSSPLTVTETSVWRFKDNL